MPIGEPSKSKPTYIDPGKVSMDSDGAQEEMVNYMGARREKPRGFWSRLWNHFKRFWICYGLLGVVFLAIFLPVFFLVILPAIAQRLVDDAAIPIQSAEVLRPTPNTITFSLAATINVPLGLGVSVDKFNLSLFDRDVKPRKPYVTAELGPVYLKGKSHLTISNQTVEVLDEEELTKFLSKAVYSKNFTMSAYGKTTAHLGKLKVPLTLDKDVELADAASIALPPKEDGSNLIGRATLPNHSLVTFALGNVTLNLKIGDVILGNGTIDNVLLRPGNNTVPLRGIHDIQKAIGNLGTILSAETDALSHGNLMLAASGHSTIYNGLHIPYFEKVLNNLTVTADVPILKVLFGTLSQLITSNPGAISNVTSALGNTDLTNSPNMTKSGGE
ncbi:hypothetical protein ATEIFO6365_0001005300 [Aspergillus terreus]|uniref:Uncharacterized protein n=1 Tax=Aspergillus terreus TaxID=33178 RepID=A0A5M3YL02_ASPTE|nr:hypothetical protein ATETN484_0001005200 [Aspergillus terreus]GFF11833.1 hypothetical protein ATEIFO6365_0001005300 [Aspergillus terreus]